MSDQAHAWSRAAERYEQEFIDPYRPDVRNPLLTILRRIPDPQAKVIADLGCGTGPLLPFLAGRFQRVLAVDFAEGMLARARGRCRVCDNIEFHQASLTGLTELAGQADVAVAVNSLVLPDVRELEAAIEQIHLMLRPRGWFLGIVPAMDAVHYLTMLFLDRALKTGKPMDAARKNAAHLADHADFDFAFGQCAFDGLEQHFWQPFEIRYRLERAGFRRLHLAKVHLAWEQFSKDEDLRRQAPPWDWFFVARRSAGEFPRRRRGQPLR
jgi:SAM-dependent methyltransferase